MFVGYQIALLNKQPVYQIKRYVLMPLLSQKNGNIDFIIVLIHAMKKITSIIVGQNANKAQPYQTQTI
jgi:hypothetical protein